MPLYGYIIRRTFSAVLTFFLVFIIVFFIFRILPGDPTLIYTGSVGALTDVEKEALLKSFGLDRPLHEQFFVQLWNFLRGEFGWSFYYRRPVIEIVAPKLLNSVILAFSSFLLVYLVTFIIAPLCVLKKGSYLEKGILLLTFLFRSIPTSLMGILALVVFCGVLGWFPVGGVVSVGVQLNYLSLDFIYHLILPTAVYSAYLYALPTLVLRGTMLEEIGKDYAILLKAKGLSNSRIVYKHILRNSLLPTVTTAALFVGTAFGGQAVIEYIFSWPGVGRELVNACSWRDYPLAQALIFISSISVIFMNLFADLVYGIIDPRVKYER